MMNVSSSSPPCGGTARLVGTLSFRLLKHIFFASPQAVRVEVKEGVNPRRVLYVCIKARTISLALPWQHDFAPSHNFVTLSATAIRDSSNFRALHVQGRQDIPLTRIGQPLTLAELEGQAADLAKFLQVPIEGL